MRFLFSGQIEYNYEIDRFFGYVFPRECGVIIERIAYAQLYCAYE
jgi:hypothetical protein